MRYFKATKSGRGVILTELCALTGWSRRHARRRLNQVLPCWQGACQVPWANVSGICHDEVVAHLRAIWAMLGGPCGKRLAPFLSEIIELLERHGEISLKPEFRDELCRMSAATIDRALAGGRLRLGIKGRSGTKPGSMLKAQIPIRTFADWDENVPGFTEIDLVAHDGGLRRRRVLELTPELGRLLRPIQAFRPEHEGHAVSRGVGAPDVSERRISA